MNDPFRMLAEKGAFIEALEILGKRFDKPWHGNIYFNMEFDPRQDLLYEGADQDPRLYRRALNLIRRGKRQEAEAAALLVLEGAVNFAFKKFGLARRIFKKSLELDDWLWARLWLFRATAYEAMTIKSMPLLEEALRMSQEMESRFKAPFFLHAWRAELYTGFDMHEEALSDLDAALRLKPDYGWALAEKADIYTQQHRLDEALACCEKLRALYPQEGWVYALRSRAWGKCGRLQESLADCDRAIGLGPVLGSMYSWRGECRRHARNFKGAISDFNAAQALDPDYPLTYLWRGAAWLQSGSLQEALRDLTRSIKLDPRNLLAYAWRGEVLLRMGRFRDGIVDFEKFHPSSPRETWSAGKGALWADMEEFVKGHPKNPWARACRGRFSLENPSYPPERSLEDFNAAIAALPRNSWCRAWRAQVYERQEKTNEALKDFNAAVRLKPRWAWAWAWRGRLKLKMGNHRGALSDFNRSLGLDPSAGEIYSWRAQAAQKSGRAEQGKKDDDFARALGCRQPALTS